MSINVGQTSLICGTCGVSHSIPTAQYDECKEDGGFWSCPNGHKRGFNETQECRDLVKAKKTIMDLRFNITNKDCYIESTIAQCNRQRRTITALRGHLTRLKNKIKKLKKLK